MYNLSAHFFSELMSIINTYLVETFCTHLRTGEDVIVSDEVQTLFGTGSKNMTSADEGDATKHTIGCCVAIRTM